MKRRSRVFVGCEGKGERALAVMLQRYADDLRQPVHFEAFDAQGGSPLTIVSKSLKEARLRAKRGGPYDGGLFVLIDQDRVDADRCHAELMAACLRGRMTFVPQVDRLESLIGKLITRELGCTTSRAERELRRLWPEVENGFDAAGLKSRITLDTLRRSHGLGAEWSRLLQIAGIIPLGPRRRR